MDQLRAQIDDIDTQIVTLLGERANVSRQIGAFKAKSGMQNYDPTREQQLHARLKALAIENDFDPETCARIYELVLANSKSVQSA